MGLFLIGCSGGENRNVQAESAIDAGRAFIDHSLKGKFESARRYMLADNENQFWLDEVSKNYNGLSEQEKTGFSTASIRIMNVADEVADSITIINYSNSYKNSLQRIKVVKPNDTWLVDLKYTFSDDIK